MTTYNSNTKQQNFTFKSINSRSSVLSQFSLNLDLKKSFSKTQTELDMDMKKYKQQLSLRSEGIDFRNVTRDVNTTLYINVHTVLTCLKPLKYLLDTVLVQSFLNLSAH